MDLKRAKRLTGLGVFGTLTGNLASATGNVVIRVPEVEIVVDTVDRGGPETESREVEGARSVAYSLSGEFPQSLCCGPNCRVMDNCGQAEEYASTMERRQISFTKDSYLSPESPEGTGGKASEKGQREEGTGQGGAEEASEA